MFKKTRVCKLQNTEKYSDRSTIFLSQSPFVTEPYHNSFPRYACITGNIGQFSWNQIIIPWKVVEKFQFWASEKSIRSLFFCPFSLVFFCLTHFTEFADRAESFKHNFWNHGRHLCKINVLYITYIQKYYQRNTEIQRRSPLTIVTLHEGTQNTILRNIV